MVTLALANRNPVSKHRAVNIDLLTKRCLLDNQPITLQQLQTNVDFSHPLLTAPVIKPLNGVCHYEYDTLDALLRFGRHVCATLIHSDDPAACRFKINPSSQFASVSPIDELYFSLHRQKRAKRALQIHAFKALIEHFGGSKFEFSDEFILFDEFSTKDLPPFIHGDALYYGNPDVVEVLSRRMDLNRFEIRYISEFMGFGVFARERVSKGEVLFHYAGLKTIHKPHSVNYTFQSDLDCFEMFTDAKAQGNWARFVNHAPKFDVETQGDSNFLHANLKAVGHCLYGVEVILFTARKDILSGEQLLVDYGEYYFKDIQVIRFKPKGQVAAAHRFTRKKRLNLIRLMAQQGVSEAQVLLNIRGGLIFFMILLIMLGANYFS